MGYYTYYTLEAKPHPQKHTGHTAKEIVAAIRKMMEDTEGAFCEFEDLLEDYEDSTAISFKMNLDEECKWYEWKEEMTQLSKSCPDTLFMIHGEGEEAGDIWNAYFLDGKCVIYEPKMPEFKIEDLE